MDPNDAQTAAESLDAMKLQIAQSLIEHHIVVQALYGVCAVCFVAVLMMGWALIWALRRCAASNAALLAVVEQNSLERVKLVKQHSLERAHEQMQMLHAFEGIASRKQRGLATSSTG